MKAAGVFLSPQIKPDNQNANDMKTKLTKHYERQGYTMQRNCTLEGEFSAGMKSGLNPCPENTGKAIAAVTRKDTAPLIRAYWSGYLCRASTDDASFFAASP